MYWFSWMPLGKPLVAFRSLRRRGGGKKATSREPNPSTLSGKITQVLTTFGPSPNSCRIFQFLEALVREKGPEVGRTCECQRDCLCVSLQSHGPVQSKHSQLFAAAWMVLCRQTSPRSKGSQKDTAGHLATWADMRKVFVWPWAGRVEVRQQEQSQGLERKKGCTAKLVQPLWRPLVKRSVMVRTCTWESFIYSADTWVPPLLVLFICLFVLLRYNWHTPFC